MKSSETERDVMLIHQCDLTTARRLLAEAKREYARRAILLLSASETAQDYVANTA